LTINEEADNLPIHIGYQSMIRIHTGKWILPDLQQTKTSIVMTICLCIVKERLQSYYHKDYLRRYINQMRIWKNAKDLPEQFYLFIFWKKNKKKTSSINAIYFSALYTTISNGNVDTHLKKSFRTHFNIKWNDKQRYKFIIIGSELTYLVRHETWGKWYIHVASWFKVEHRFPILSSDCLVYYQIFKWWSRSLSIFNRTSISHTEVDWFIPNDLTLNSAFERSYKSMLT